MGRRVRPDPALTSTGARSAHCRPRPSGGVFYRMKPILLLQGDLITITYMGRKYWHRVTSAAGDLPPFIGPNSPGWTRITFWDSVLVWLRSRAVRLAVALHLPKRYRWWL